MSAEIVRLAKGDIALYLEMAETLRQRCAEIGKDLQTSDHFALEKLYIRTPFPFITSINYSFVSICVGTDNAGNRVIVDVPVGLVEQPLNIKSWVSAVNADEDTRLQQLEMQSEEGKKRQRLAVMKELVQMYPSEARELISD